MEFLLDGIRQAWQLLLHPDAPLKSAFDVTLRVAFFSTLLALIAGLPTGLAFGLRSFRGRSAGLSLVNAGLGLPPVVVGLIVATLLFRNGPLGGLNLLYTVNGIIVAQALLAFPIVAAFTATAVQAVPLALLEQASALGASRFRVAMLALREARVGIFAAAIGALGSALSEVGAVVLVGGNIQEQTQTLASAVLVQVSAGDYGEALAYGFILLGLILVLAAVLTLLQQRGAAGVGWRAS
jgi:tungstate transport system permease protein